MKTINSLVLSEYYLNKQFKIYYLNEQFKIITVRMLKNYRESR